MLLTKFYEIVTDWPTLLQRCVNVFKDQLSHCNAGHNIKGALELVVNRIRKI